MKNRITTIFRIMVGVGFILSMMGGRILRAEATPTDLFISEYIEGSSYNKAIEIFNGTGSPVDLEAGEYNLQIYFNGSVTAGLTLNLTGTVADGDVFVIANSNATTPADPAILAAADLVSFASFFNGDDAVVLRKGTTLLDVIGQIGLDPGTQWGVDLVSTADNTLRRMDSICAGDPDGSNVFDPAVEWVGYANNTFDGLGSHSATSCAVSDTAPVVASTNPLNNAVDIALDSNVLINFSEAVNVSGDWFSISCTVSGTHTATVSGGPTAFTLDPGTDFVKNDVCTVTVVAANVTDQDSLDPPDNMAANYSFSFNTLADVCLLPFTPIHAVQGSGAASPLVGQIIDVQGIVVGDFQNNATPDNGNLNGFHLQSVATDEDADPMTSEGVFIYFPSGTLDVATGDGVRVRGRISEYNGMTEITASNVWPCSTGNTVTPTSLSLPVATVDAFEPYEGMLVTFPQPLVISEYFDFDRYGEIVLTSTRHMTPTALYEPGSLEAYQAAQEFLLDKITLDDGRTTQNPDPAIHPDGAVFTMENLFRGGDTVANVTGVIDYSFGLYRIQPTIGADYVSANPRPIAVPDVGGSLKVVSMNTLNYFTTLDLGPDICGPMADQECRGADTAEEFARQHDKLVAAIMAMDADIIGMIEIENNATDAPLEFLVNALNTIAGPGTYDFVHTGPIGTDAIRSALLYKPGSVSLLGDFAILDSSVDARFLDNKNRPVLAQSFMDTNGGVFTVAVNHFKSKGSDCNDVGDPDLGDGAGNCNLTRKAAAQALVDWLDSDPTGSGDLDVMIIGDLNSYDKEDPIDAILAGPDDTPGTFDDYVDMTFRFEGEYAYSYVFDGQIGYLDFAMTATLADQVTGTTTWHVNADEPDLIDYDMSFKLPAQDALYAPDFYRYSDHDPVIIGLNLIPAYDFTGFYDPVMNAPVVNIIKAGSTVPVKFSLGGNWGKDIFEYGYPVLMKCKDCTFSSFEPDKLLYMDKSKLLYDAKLDQYIFTWKTKKDWSGTCWILNILLNDGSIHQAYFKIK